MRRKRCSICGLLTYNWQAVNLGSVHCFDGCYSTTGRDRRSPDGSHWKAIDGFPDYQVSQFGEVRSLKFDKIRILKQRYLGVNRAYRGVSLWKDGKEYRYYVHRLVLETFGGKPWDTSLEVNHKDGNKSNNHLRNLEWCTSSENKQHGVDNGLYPVGEHCSWSILNQNDIRRIHSMRRSGMSHQAISEHFPVGRRHISRILQGTRWKQYNGS